MTRDVEILIVEDSPTQAESLRYALEKRGYGVRVARDGSEALAAVQRLKPALVISDIVMPVMDGLTLCKQITTDKGFEDLPVLLITSMADPVDVLLGLESGADNYLIKPFQEERLFTLIKELLASRGNRRSAASADSDPIEVSAGGQRFSITAERRIILDFFLSAYESAIESNLKLRTSRSAFHNIVDRDADGIVIVDQKGLVRFLNPAAESLLGCAAAETLGKPFCLPVVGGKATEFDIPRTGKTAMPVEMLVAGTQWEGEQAYIASIRDISERKRLQEEVERARQRELKTKDEFLSHVSHELRSPLTSIHQFATILLDGLGGPLNADQREYLEIIFRNGKQLAEMIEDLLLVTRFQSAKLAVEPRFLSAREVLHDVIASLQPSAAASGVALGADLPAWVPPICADPDRFRQILVNLIQNGIKFTPQGGRISVRAHVHEDDPGFLCVEVKDTGIGIGKENLASVFDRLYQESQEIDVGRQGLGLGLYICQELVIKHGGKIWVESEVSIPRQSRGLYKTVSRSKRLAAAARPGTSCRFFVACQFASC